MPVASYQPLNDTLRNNGLTKKYLKSVSTTIRYIIDAERTTRYRSSRREKEHMMTHINSLNILNNFSAGIHKADTAGNGNKSITTYVLPDDKNSMNARERTLLMRSIAECFNIGKNNDEAIKEILRYLDYLDTDEQCINSPDCGDGIIDVNKAMAFIEALKTDKKTRDDFIGFLTTVINTYKNEKPSRKNDQIIKDLRKVIDIIKELDLSMTAPNTYITGQSTLLRCLLNS